jgi:hypothetical protein
LPCFYTENVRFLLFASDRTPPSTWTFADLSGLT